MKPHTCWSISEHGYLEAPGASVLAFHDIYPEGKQGGVEIIHHGERVAACGDLRLELAPGQWAALPTAGERKVDRESLQVQVSLSYPKVGLSYTVRLQADGDAVRLTVDLDTPLDPAQQGPRGPEAAC